MRDDTTQRSSPSFSGARHLFACALLLVPPILAPHRTVCSTETAGLDTVLFFLPQAMGLGFGAVRQGRGRGPWRTGALEVEARTRQQKQTHGGRGPLPLARRQVALLAWVWWAGGTRNAFQF